MHRGMNPDYQRAPVPPPRYEPAGPEAGSTFQGAFNRAGFPSHFPNLVSYPRSVPPPGFQSFSTEQPSYQVAAPPAHFPSGWTLNQDELQNLEVKKKAEEFLRMLETDDWIKPTGKSGDKGTRRPSVDGEPERHPSEKHSRGRSRSTSRSRSRGRSRGKSRARSRGRSRARSRTRSRSRGKSRTRAKSRPHSRSRGRSLARSKSQPRLCKDYQRSVTETAVPSGSARVPDLFQNLKQVIQSKEQHLSVVKNTFMINQNPEDTRLKQKGAPLQNLPEFLLKPRDPENAVLPHEREYGSDSTARLLSWNDPGLNRETFPDKCAISSVEDEEEFLYGEDKRKKPQAVTVPLAQTRRAENPISKPLVLQEAKVQPVTSRRPPTPDVTAEECERVKTLLKTIGLNLNPADISKMAARLKQKQEGQREANANTSPGATLEPLLNHSKVQKSDDSRSNRSESSHSHRESDHRESEKKEREEEFRKKQIQKKRKEYLVKELEGLLKHEGSGDLIPVIGFFCQRCEEFFGDLKSAEGHKHTNTHQNISQDQQLKDEKRPREHEPTEWQEEDERNGERKRPRDDSRSTESRVQDDAQSGKSSKKKKKKEKKKKEKKKEKKVKVKSNK